MEKHIYNKTKFVICDVSKCNNFDNSNKFKIWILLNIDPHNFESVTITNNNDELFVLSNWTTIWLPKNTGAVVCATPTNYELRTTRHQLESLYKSATVPPAQRGVFTMS